MTKKKDTKQLTYACSGTIGYLSKPKLNKSREFSSHYTENYNAEQLVDKSTGQLSYKQETQVKFKESINPNKIGSSSSKSNYNNNKNHNPFWKLVRTMSTTEKFPKKRN
ncbi:hypothetical protein D8674_008741 [Pyrus ussuriensis x Pyrus communis]|uniref:Uncharacterized protein n=1 Tax=Pyrus ussuriensis x Pyrus communis TaxID=2448454 RepID=A0A5N5HYF9_9ROSA|nr:hypothetical protein D8674_008741 [Pyrus ussuriensis x Pyrus communis]